jgi:hypothetical protein
MKPSVRAAAALRLPVLRPEEEQAVEVRPPAVASHSS